MLTDRITVLTNTCLLTVACLLTGAYLRNAVLVYLPVLVYHAIDRSAKALVRVSEEG